MRVLSVLLPLLFASVFSLEGLLSRTSYGLITFYTRPEPSFISGEFSPQNEGSIKLIFYSEVSDGNQQVTLTDGNKNVIIKYVISPDGIAFIQVGQLNFIGHKTADTILHVPTTEIPIISNHNLLRDQIEKLSKSNITVQHALGLTFSMREYELVEDMSRAMDEVLGSHGRDYPSVMSVYLISRTLIQSRSSILSANDPFLARDTRNSVCTVIHDDPTLADTSTCDKVAEGAVCQGLCGPGATCWDFVCGDCCYHQGCSDHDTCCGENGMFSIKCFAPTDFTCDSYAC